MLKPFSEQSNHLRTVAVAAATQGFERYLLVRTPDGKAPKSPQGNFLLMKLNNAKMRFCTPQEYKNKIELLQEMANEVQKRGHVPLIIPEGGSGSLGCWGYISCFQEILTQLNPTHIVVSVGSGGSLAGLLLGREIMKRNDIEIIGVPICDSAEYFTSAITTMFEDFNKDFQTNFKPKPKFWDSYIGEAGKGYPQEMKLLQNCFEIFGILFDVKYSGKGFYAMCDKIVSGQGGFSENCRVVFIHTGGAFSTFAAVNEYHFE